MWGMLGILFWLIKYLWQKCITSRRKSTFLVLLMIMWNIGLNLIRKVLVLEYMEICYLQLGKRKVSRLNQMRNRVLVGWDNNWRWNLVGIKLERKGCRKNRKLIFVLWLKKYSNLIFIVMKVFNLWGIWVRVR